jgi:hypothetical protein
VPLGSLHGPLEPLLGSLWTPKTLKTFLFFRFLQMQDVRSLKLLVAHLGPSWPLLGPTWSQNGPQNGPQSGAKHVQKLVQKLIPKITPNMPVWGSKMDPKLGSTIPTLIEPGHPGHVFVDSRRGTLVTRGLFLLAGMVFREHAKNEGPRWTQEGPRWS